MKQMKIAGLLIIPIIILFVYNNLVVGNQVKDIELPSSYEEFDYTELKEHSQVIALIRVKDDLDYSNSTVTYNGDSPDISGFYGTRSVEVIRYFKNDVGTGKMLSIIEPAIITRDNEYIRTEDYEKMEKNKYYVVFLSDDNASGQLSILSANNGKINVSDWKNNEYEDIRNLMNREFKALDILKTVK